MAGDDRFPGFGHAARPSRLAGAAAWTDVPSGFGPPMLPGVADGAGPPAAAPDN